LTRKELFIQLKWRDDLIQIGKNNDIVKNFFLSLNDGVVKSQLIHFKFLVVANLMVDEFDFVSFSFEYMLI